MSKKYKSLNLLISFSLCILILLTYQLLIWLGALPASDGIHQQEKNLIKLEHFVYDNQIKDKIVFVGSSLTDNIPTNLTDFNAVNLGMSGGCAQTGLEIIKITKSRPNLVFVEISDTIDRGINREFVSYFDNQLSYFSRLYLPMLRAQYRPVSIFVSYLQKHKNSQADTLNIKDEETNKQSSLEKLIIQRIVDTNQRDLDDKEINLFNHQAQIIQNQILSLKNNGIRVILYRVPLDPSLDNTIRQQQIQKMLKSFFPENKYEWMPEFSTEDWQTYDGTHLKTESAKKYADYLKKTIINQGYLSSN